MFISKIKAAASVKAGAIGAAAGSTGIDDLCPRCVAALSRARTGAPPGNWAALRNLLHSASAGRTSRSRPKRRNRHTRRRVAGDVQRAFALWVMPPRRAFAHLGDSEIARMPPARDATGGPDGGH